MENNRMALVVYGYDTKGDSYAPLIEGIYENIAEGYARMEELQNSKEYGHLEWSNKIMIVRSGKVKTKEEKISKVPNQFNETSLLEIPMNRVSPQRLEMWKNAEKQRQRERETAISDPSPMDNYKEPEVQLPDGMKSMREKYNKPMEMLDNINPSLSELMLRMGIRIMNNDQ